MTKASKAKKATTGMKLAAREFKVSLEQVRNWEGYMAWATMADRFAARERRKERDEIVKAIRNYAHFGCVPTREVLKELDQVVWIVKNIGCNTKPAKNGGRR